MLCVYVCVGGHVCGPGCAGMGEDKIDGVSLVGRFLAQVERMEFNGVVLRFPGVQL